MSYVTPIIEPSSGLRALHAVEFAHYTVPCSHHAQCGVPVVLLWCILYTVHPAHTLHSMHFTSGALETAHCVIPSAHCVHCALHTGTL